MSSNRCQSSPFSRPYPLQQAQPGSLTRHSRQLLWAASTLVGLSAIALGLGHWMRLQSSQWTTTESIQQSAVLLNYNLISHGIWLALVIALLAALWYEQSQSVHSGQQTKALDPNRREKTRAALDLWHQIKLQPMACLVLAATSAFLIHEASWFYKEIIGWYDDIYADNLLNNFSLRPNLISETLTRNDFRFYPIAFADLQILSWFTPYVKIWMIFNAIELIATIAIGVRIIKRTMHMPEARELLLMFSLLYIATAPSAFSYMQFIYSERMLTLLFAVFLWNYIDYKTNNSAKAANTALGAALLGTFCKDTAIILFIVPAIATLISNQLQTTDDPSPKLSLKNWRCWTNHYQFELRIVGLALFFITSFLYLTYLPSIIAGEQRYDANLTMTQFEPDARLAMLTAYISLRAFQIGIRKSRFTPLDGANLAALSYVGALYWLVGYSSTNYMALPMHLIAVIDILALWCMGPRHWLKNKVNHKTITAAGLLSSAAVIYVELQFPGNAYTRVKNIMRTHRSWRATFNQSALVLRDAKRQGNEVNVIISKSWFRRFNHLKRLHYDRLIYLNEDSITYRIIDGKDKGGSYTPEPGDFFLDLDTGKRRIEEYGINTTNFEQIYKFSPNVSNGHIYIKRR